MNAYEYWFNLAKKLDTTDLKDRLKGKAMDYVEKHTKQEYIEEMAEYNEIGENKIRWEIENGVYDYIETLFTNQL